MNLFVGYKLKIFRKNIGWTQERMSDQLFISQSAYARMENGQSQSWAGHIDNICKIFEIKPEALFRREEEIKSVETGHDEMTQNALLSVYQKIIKKYETQILELEQSIRDLKEDNSNKKGSTCSETA
jgi:transcriptional regulator with XRE-family HTH domain